MASSNDYTVSRFLFAILQQKSLKDIDWNQVAQNPILAQPITNGHAARMRFSRFRQNILGHENKPRNRNPAKSKVPKSKKETRAKKETDDQVKPLPQAAIQEDQQDLTTGSHQIKIEPLLVKTEAHPSVPDGRDTSAPELPSNGSLTDAHMHFQNRLLTPCSDADLFSSTHHGFSTSPVSSEFHHDQAFGYTGAAAQCAGHDSNTWPPSPSPYSPFINPYDIDRFNGTQFGEQQQQGHPDDFSISPSDMMAHDQPHAPVKHEEWDARFPS